MESDYAIIGIHPGNGRQAAGAEPIAGIPDNSVFARIRMKVGKDLVDENFVLPDLPGPIPLELQPPVYESLIRDKIFDRISELKNKRSKSAIHDPKHNVDQAIHKGAAT